MTSPVVGMKTSEITPRQEFLGHTSYVDGVIHLPDDQRMMTCSRDGSLRVWNLKSGKQVGKEWRDGKSSVWRIALSPDGKKVVSGSEDGGVRLWDIETGKIIAKWMGHTKEVPSVCWSRDGRRVLSGSYDGTARQLQWDVLENGETILAPFRVAATTETGHTHVYAAIYSPDTTLIATGGYDNAPSTAEYKECPVKIWDANTGKLVATLKGHTHSVNHLAWTTDGKKLVSGSDDHSIRIWNTITWKQITVLDGHTSGVFAIAISPNNRILASTLFDNTAQLWNLDNGQPISSLRHVDIVSCVSFSADGKLLATGCDDYNTYTWDVYAILREAGLDDLLLDVDDDQSVPDATRIRRPVQPLKVSNRVPRGFFDESLDPSHLSAQPRTHTSSRSRLFHWAQNLLSGSPSGAQVELHERSSAVVDVPYAKGKRRNASAREKRRPIPKNAAASSPRPPNGNVTQRFNGTARAQTFSSTTPSAVATTISSNPRVTINHAGRWTRFWLFICCASTEYTDDHH